MRDGKTGVCVCIHELDGDWRGVRPGNQTSGGVSRSRGAQLGRQRQDQSQPDDGVDGEDTVVFPREMG